MREITTIATMFLLLAAAGIEPSHAQVAKTCKISAINILVEGC